MTSGYAVMKRMRTVELMADLGIKPRRASPEADLQAAVIEHLTTYRTPGTWWLHIPNQGKRTPAEAAKLKRMGLLPGAPDLLIRVKGQPPLWLELKAPDGRLSEAQRDFSVLAVSSGDAWMAAYGLDDAIHILRQYGALKPDRARRAA